MLGQTEGIAIEVDAVSESPRIFQHAKQRTVVASDLEDPQVGMDASGSSDGLKSGLRKKMAVPATSPSEARVMSVGVKDLVVQVVSRSSRNDRVQPALPEHVEWVRRMQVGEWIAGRFYPLRQRQHQSCD